MSDSHRPLSASLSVPPLFAPIDRARVREDENALRLYRVLLRWIPYAVKKYGTWSGRERCGHFFGGSYWYGLETSSCVLVFAIAAKLGAYDPAITGVSRERLIEMAVSAVRYLGFTHESGPEDCVREESVIPACSKTKWGGKNDRYFMATQTGVSMNRFAVGAWLLQEELDEETRGLVHGVVSWYADRWAKHEALNGSWFDTQCEENGWTALGIATAAHLFPSDARAAEWMTDALRWAAGSVGTFRDRIEEGWEGNAKVTFFPDWTTENHAFVHPNYMSGGINLRGLIALMASMKNEVFPEALTSHNFDVYDNTLLPWTQPDGGILPLQGQDWWYNRQHDSLNQHNMMEMLHDHAEAAAAVSAALSTIERIQLSNSRGCLLEENGEDIIVMPQAWQTVESMEHQSASELAMAYLVRVFCRPAVPAPMNAPGEEAAEAEAAGTVATAQAASEPKRWQGVREYPYGSIIMYGTGDALSSFSWRNHVMALTFPKQGTWDITPLYAGYTGTVRLSPAAGGKGEISDEYVVEAQTSRIVRRTDGFGATARLARAGGALTQDIAFVALPDGASVYAERILANRDCGPAEISSGLIGIRNERYACLPDLASGARTVRYEGGAAVFAGFLGERPDERFALGTPRWLNMDRRVGYVLFGSAGIEYVNKHEYPKWKGIENELILNARRERQLERGRQLPTFVALTLPNADETATAAAAAHTFLLAAAHPETVVLLAPQYLVYANFGDRPTIAAADRTLTEAEPGTIPVFAGHTVIEGGKMTWRQRLEERESGYLPRLCELRLQEPRAVGLRLAVNAAADRIVLLNEGDTALTVTVDDASPSRPLHLASKQYAILERS